MTPTFRVSTAFPLSLLNRTIWRADVLLHAGVEVISHLPLFPQSALQQTNPINPHNLPAPNLPTPSLHPYAVSLVLPEPSLRGFAQTQQGSQRDSAPSNVLFKRPGMPSDHAINK